MFDIEGKTALVTGATGGIGEAISRCLVEAGVSLAISGTRVEKLNELAAELAPKVVPIACNLSDREAVRTLVPRSVEALGSVDILVNNAGITRDTLFLRMDESKWDLLMEINLNASMLLSKAVLRGMMKKRSGRIINISSVVGFVGNAGQTNYAASKSAIVGLSKSLSIEVANRGITVNCVAPGLIGTEMTSGLSGARLETILASIPANRMGTAEEVAASVLFLASKQAAYITGQTLHVNGGMARI